ncbi:hypothetical protein KX928_00250 [Roseobacter sp. YSTF-M11]|uniref:Pre ATP-grasp domain-containing protein n=1 Tax=Roseobacter insulae TaxID=2859783 RepID=A0A9X1FR25_9RHOB|nr:hypothetical protein [Roseobacter insulae]MBW4706209.1 hypothetical protein [Roseobacter insulae]
MPNFSPTVEHAGEDIAKALVRDEPAFLSALDFGPCVRQGTGDGPSLLIGDSSEIALLSADNGSRLEHRMALLARRGDHVLLRRRDPDFEDYLSTSLGLANVTFHEGDPRSHVPLTKQAWTSQAWVDTFAALADQAKGLTIKSYITTGHIWRLAQRIGERCGRVIHVCGPSPQITRRANDKLWFAQVARRVLGENATPPTLSAYGPAATAGLVQRIGKTADHVIVKVPDSAGSAGNLRLDSTVVRGMPLADLRTFLLERLYALGWHDRYPVLVGVWDEGVESSPSVQLWLPHAAAGPPQVEGVFEQHVQTGAATFVGASQSTLGRGLQNRLRLDARRLAAVFQQLGYYGRCSLDAVICRSPRAAPTIHWIECNARWGGVSIPMTVARQLGDSRTRRAISIAQEVMPDRHMTTRDQLLLLQDLLLRVDRQTTGIVILSPPDSSRGLAANLFAIAETQRAAADLLRDAMHRLIRAAE